MISTSDKDKGVAKVTIDGKVYSADMYNETTKYEDTVLEVSDLSEDDIHTITVEYSGLYALGSSAADIDIDAFDIVNGNIQ